MALTSDATPQPRLSTSRTRNPIQDSSASCPIQADSNRSPPGRNRFKKSRSKGIDPVENWAWGLSLIVLTIAIHTTGVIFMAFATVRIRVRLESGNRLELRQVLAINIGLIAMVGLLLAALHGIEAAVWAAAYWWFGALSSPVEALLYSVDSMSTRGASGLVLERHWRMMGALEAMDGMLLFGISTAYIFAVMQGYWSLLTGHRPH